MKLITLVLAITVAVTAFPSKQFNTLHQTSVAQKHGVRKASPSANDGIVGGEPTEDGSYPWVVSLQLFGSL